MRRTSSSPSFQQQAYVRPGVAMALAFLLCLSVRAWPQSQQAAPKNEVRAVWITTAAGLDWPKSLDRAEQQASLRTIVAGLKAAHFNTILFQVRARGDAYYRSSYEPWAENLTGTLGKDPGWDPLAFLLNEAHLSGLEVHAWFNVYKVRGPSTVSESTPPHPAIRFAPWLYDVAGDGWLDPGAPEIRQYLLRVALELVQGYDIDGINFDFARYPGRDFPDEATYRRYGRSQDRDDWRRGNITAFVAAFHDSVDRIKPMLKVGAAPMGVFSEGSGTSSWGAYSSYYQNARGWIQNGFVDYLSPQLYWDLQITRDDPGFADIGRTWVLTSAGRQIWAGIGAYKPEVMRELPQQIDSARAIGADGEAFFRYEFVRDPKVLGDRYATLADIPPMTWKDSVPPRAPVDLTVVTVSPSVVHLEWKPPVPAPDGDSARYYNIYRSTDERIDPGNAAELLSIIPAGMTSFEDTLPPGTADKYYFAVSAQDKGNNEGPLSAVTSAVLSGLLALRGKLTDATSLSASFSREDGTTIIAYRIGRRSPVLLRVTDQTEDSSKGGGLTLASGLREAGTYIVGIPPFQLRPGSYLLRLTAGDAVVEQPLDISR